MYAVFIGTHFRSDATTLVYAIREQLFCVLVDDNVPYLDYISVNRYATLNEALAVVKAFHDSNMSPDRKAFCTCTSFKKWYGGLVAQLEEWEEGVYERNRLLE